MRQNKSNHKSVNFLPSLCRLQTKNVHACVCGLLFIFSNLKKKCLVFSSIFASFYYIVQIHHVFKKMKTHRVFILIDNGSSVVFSLFCRFYNLWSLHLMSLPWGLHPFYICVDTFTFFPLFTVSPPLPRHLHLTLDFNCDN